MFLELWNHTSAVDPAWFWKGWMKTVADAILSYYILYHYFKISKIYQQFMQASNQAQALVLIYYWRAQHDFKNDWMKTVGADAFITYHILYHYFKLSKILQKFKNSLIGKKKHKPGEWYYTWCLYANWKLSD